MSPVGFLVFAIASISTMSIGGTALPLWLGGTGHWNALAIDVLTFFTGGVFLGAGMLHMLPEAARQAEEAGITSPLVNPFTFFCVGYLLVYVIEQHQHSQLTKEGLLAVAQRARTSGLDGGVGTASICVVDVPPVTTYHDMSAPLVSTLHAALLEQPSKLTGLLVAIDGADSYGHKVDSYSHGHAEPAAQAHAHGHGHAHGGDCCGGEHKPAAAHEHGHGQQLEALELEQSGQEHGHAHPAHPPPGGGHPGMWRDPSTGESLLGATGGPGEGVSPGTWRALSGHGGGTATPGSGHSHSPPPPRPPWPSHESSGGNGWYDESGCECPSHDHVHPGVRHKHLAVGSASATFPLVLALLFSVHSFIAGLALGIQSEKSSSAVAILIAILGHKFVEALSLASSFVREGVGLSTSASVLLVYCCMTPLGILTGRGVLSLGQSAATAECLISGLASGSFTFLAAHELTHTAATSQLSKRLRAVLAFAGMGCMAVLSIWV